MPESIVKSMHACLERLIGLKAPSRLGRKDASLYSHIPGATEHASGFLGWTSLASKPPLAVAEIQAAAAEILADGLDAVVLIGQGGSSQASMTITKLHEVATGRRDESTGALAPEAQQCDVAFRTMDSLSPVFVNHILGASDPARTLYIVSSKSGSTIEPLMLERVAWQYVAGRLGSTRASERFAAVTDPGSGLEELARERGYRIVLNSPKDVGGRFSALTAFTLFPAALVGIDIEQVVLHATDVEYACMQDNEDNPALRLAAFIYANYQAGRDKISVVMPPSGQVFGLWIEQLVAESLGKHGKGILPNVEVDASILSVKRKDRCVITYEVGHPEGFSESISSFHPSIPALHFTLNSVFELFGRFVVWEFAIAMLGIMLEVNPFDQPDVEDTKQRVRELLAALPQSNECEAIAYGANAAAATEADANIRPQAAEQASAPNLASPAIANPAFAACDAAIDIPTGEYLRIDYPATDYVRVLRASNAMLEKACVERQELRTVDQALRALLGTLGPGDYFSLNAFLPFRGYGRREALERMRNRVASRLGNVSCLEIGPRYLHSTGQLHKGGANNGVFLYISADELEDIAIPQASYTLGELAAMQALGDFEALASRSRRALHVHLSSNDSETLARFADRLCLAVSAVI